MKSPDIVSPPPPLQESWPKPKSVSSWKIGQGHLIGCEPLVFMERLISGRCSSGDLLLFDLRGGGEVGASGEKITVGNELED